MSKQNTTNEQDNLYFLWCDPGPNPNLTAAKARARRRQRKNG